MNGRRPALPTRRIQVRTVAGRAGRDRVTDEGATPYYDFLRAEFNTEEARKVSLEQRGANVISSTAGISAIVVGVIGIVFRPAAGFVPASSFRILLILALLTLVLAALTSLWVVTPRSITSVGTEDLQAIATIEVWGQDAEVARAGIARELVEAIVPLRALNIKKARYLQVALLLEVAGVVAIVAGAAMLALSQ